MAWSAWSRRRARSRGRPAEGIDVRIGSRVLEVCPRGDGAHELSVDGSPTPEAVIFDRILVATGRVPRTEHLGLDSVGVNVDARGAVIVDRRLRTSAHGIYAVGDVTGLLAFTHVTAHHARVATPKPSFTPGVRSPRRSPGSPSPTPRWPGWGSPRHTHASAGAIG